jgi:hypothetical protein
MITRLVPGVSTDMPVPTPAMAGLVVWLWLHHSDGGPAGLLALQSVCGAEGSGAWHSSAILCPSWNTDQGVYGACRLAGQKPQCMVKATNPDGAWIRGQNKGTVRVPVSRMERTPTSSHKGACGNGRTPNSFGANAVICVTEEDPGFSGCCAGWRQARPRPGSDCSMGHRSRSPVDRVLSECKVHGTRKVVNYTVL